MTKPKLRNIDLHVTEEIIDHAIRSNSTACLLAAHGLSKQHKRPQVRSPLEQADRTRAGIGPACS